MSSHSSDENDAQKIPDKIDVPDFVSASKYFKVEKAIWNSKPNYCGDELCEKYSYSICCNWTEKKAKKIYILIQMINHFNLRATVELIELNAKISPITGDTYVYTDMSTAFLLKEKHTKYLYIPVAAQKAR